jgi:cell division protein FtsI (penicillin-binding protein 3)
MIATFAVVTAFAFRLVDLQVFRAPSLDAQSAATRSLTTPLYANRGAITSSNGTVLAATVLKYDVTAAPVNAAKFTRKNKAGHTVTVTVSQAMQEIAAITGSTAAAMTTAITSHPKSEFAYLAKSVDVAESQAVASLHIPYVYLQRTTGRIYPDGAVAGNLLGFTGTSGPLAGLEYQQNACLASTNGSETFDRGADGVTIPGTTTVTKKPVNGGTVKTTIDATLQYEVQQDLGAQVKALGAQSATAIVMKASDASLLTVADYPTVDPNNINGSPAADLYSRAFTDLYEPGSTMKAMTAASLLDAGKATPYSQALVPDVRRFPWGGTIHDAETHPVEHLTLTGVLAQSSNVGITLLGQALTPQQRYDYMLKFGLGSPSAVHFPGEPTAPLQPASAWDQQTVYNSMFGQGISATAIQMAGIFQTIANHGVRMPVSLVESCTASDGKVTEVPKKTGTRVVSASAADQTVKMLESTITSGTLSTMAPIPGYVISAKTGTAQVADAPGGGYGNDYITSVAGMIPAANPQYVILVTFTKPTTNKTSAGVGPAFRAITQDVLHEFEVPPSTQPAAGLPVTW